MGKDTAWAEGNTAFISGMDIYDNPYDEDDMEAWKNWDDGWHDAEEVDANTYDTKMGDG